MSKKIVDLETLQIYDNKIKEYIGKQTLTDTKLENSGEDTFDGILSVTGALDLPNSPQTPDKSQVVVTDERIVITADKPNTGLVVVDGSDAVVTKIQGSTVKCENLFDISTATIDEKGYVRFKCPDFTVGETYTFSCAKPITVLKVSVAAVLVGSVIKNDVNGFTSYTFAFSRNDNWAENAALYVYIKIQGSDDYVTDISQLNGYDLQFNKGPTALPYQPYFTGLKSAKISGIKSTGRNLFDISKITHQSDNFWNNGDGTLTVQTYGAWSGTTLSEACPTLKVGDWIKLSIKDNGKATRIIYLTTAAVTLQQNNPQPVTQEMLDSEMFFYGIPGTNDSNRQPVLIEEIQILRSRDGGNADPIPEYEPYTESIMTLPETVELGKWDYIENEQIVRQSREITFTGEESQWQEGKITNAGDGKIFHIDLKFEYGIILTRDGDIIAPVCNHFTGVLVPGAWENRKPGECFANGESCGFVAPNINMTLSEWKEYVKNLYNSGNPLVIVAKNIDVISTEPITFNNKYSIDDNGSEETLVPDENGLTCYDYGAKPSIHRWYYIHENPTEAANKAYVNNGLAKKLDKTGGVITGSLVVEGITDTALGAIVSKSGDTAYGLAYDDEDEAYKLGQGSVGENGDFTFNEGEGSAIALRDDSSTFADGNLALWSSSGNKFVAGDMAAMFTTFILNAVYPVGSIYMSAVDTNPGTFLGGNWERWGAGRVPVGFKNGDSDFGTVPQDNGANGWIENQGGAGGEKTHTLTTNEMPSHDHSISHNSISVTGGSHAHSLAFYASSDPNGGTAIGNCYPPNGKSGSNQGYLAFGDDSERRTYTLSGASSSSSQLRVVGEGSNHSHNISITSTIHLRGGSAAHNNLQPYITCYMWKRVG